MSLKHTLTEDVTVTWLATLVFCVSLIAATMLLDGCAVYEPGRIASVDGDDEDGGVIGSAAAAALAQGLTASKCHSDSTNRLVRPGQDGGDAALNMRLSGLSTGWKWRGNISGFPTYESWDGLEEYRVELLSHLDSQTSEWKIRTHARQSTAKKFDDRTWYNDFYIHGPTFVGPGIYTYGWDRIVWSKAAATLWKSTNTNAVPINWTFCTQ